MTRLPYRFAALLLALAVASSARADSPPTDRPLRAGIIGLDTSHVIAFTKTLNDPKASGELAGVRVVAAFPGGSADFPPSRDRVERFTQQVRDMGVEIVDSIPALLQKVDVVLLESVDGRPHLEQVRPVFAAGKPVFIDKPLAGSLADAIAIEELGRQHKAIWFSTSSLRFYPGIAAMRENEKVGKVTGCDAWGPCEIQPTHPDLYWYGIHGVETLYAIMGPGCQTVSRTHTDHTDEVVGVWKDGRVGTFRGIRPPALVSAAPAGQGGVRGDGVRHQGRGRRRHQGRRLRPAGAGDCEVLQNPPPARRVGRDGRGDGLHGGRRREQAPGRPP
jgi:hypothetical protein